MYKVVSLINSFDKLHITCLFIYIYKLQRSSLNKCYNISIHVMYIKFVRDYKYNNMFIDSLQWVQVQFNKFFISIFTEIIGPITCN